MTNILIVDRTDRVFDLIRQEKDQLKANVDRVRHVDEVLDRCRQKTYDLLIWETSAAKQDRDHGLEVIEVLAQDSPSTQIIVIGEEEDTNIALDSISAGGYQYLLEPFDPEHFYKVVRLALANQPIGGGNDLLNDLKNNTGELEGIFGISLPMQRVFNLIREAAKSDVSVLITGPTGVGKDMVASAIHKLSERKLRPFVVVNTGAMPSELIGSELFGHQKGAFTGAVEDRPGRFEEANSGTLFLDEIGTMDQKAQVSLLRLLENHYIQRVGGRKRIKVDVRVIAATNEDLEYSVKKNDFREDLFYRFDVFRIEIPPLRQRTGDIPLLAERFISNFNTKYNKTIARITPDAMSYLERYSWPGNVRELQNMMQRMVLLCHNSDITSDMLPARIKEHADNGRDSLYPIHVGMSMKDVEREFIAMTLKFCKGNKSKTADMLSMGRPTLYRKLREYDLT